MLEIHRDLGLKPKSIGDDFCPYNCRLHYVCLTLKVHKMSVLQTASHKPLPSTLGELKCHKILHAAGKEQMDGANDLAIGTIS